MSFLMYLMFQICDSDSQIFSVTCQGAMYTKQIYKNCKKKKKICMKNYVCQKIL